MIENVDKAFKTMELGLVEMLSDMNLKKPTLEYDLMLWKCCLAIGYLIKQLNKAFLIDPLLYRSFSTLQLYLIDY